MLKPLSLFIFTLFALAACGPGDSLSKSTAAPAQETQQNGTGIVGGKIVKAGDPLALSLVALRDKSSRENICTGTLLSSQIVLTAGHCVEDYLGSKTSELEIVIGVSSWSRDEASIFTSQKIITHPIYADKDRKERDAKIKKDCLEKNCGLHTFAGVDEGDIALILLQSPIPSEKMIAVSLNEKPKSYVNGTKGLVAGYGLHDLNNEDDSGFLRTFETEIYRTYKDVDVGAFKKVVVPSNYDDGSCVGDSGGPVFIKIKGKMLQVGVGSGSLELDPKNRFACGMKSLGYTDIASYLPWILESRQALEAILVTPQVPSK